MTEHQCSTCKWFQQHEEEEWGACNRYPPQVVVRIETVAVTQSGMPTITSNLMPLFPAVKTTQACGEWHPVIYNG